MKTNNPAAQQNPAPETEITVNPFVLTCGAFPPGQADAFLASQTDPVRRVICEAELAYYRGTPERCAAVSEQLKGSDDPLAVAGAFLIGMICALSLGNTGLILDTLRQVGAISATRILWESFT